MKNSIDHFLRGIAIILVTSASLAMSPAAQSQSFPATWDTTKIYKAPAYSRVEKMDADNVKAVLINGPEYNGEGSRFFAYYGIPEGADADHPVPGVVLVHGALGTAFWLWVSEWVKKGYAAIALDTNGKLPIQIPGDPLSLGIASWTPLLGGTQLWWGGYDRGLRPAENQWPYLAVSEIAIAHSFLRNLPGVDADKTGITGNSWGGYLTLLSTAVDGRFKFSAPLYACAYYDEFKSDLLPGKSEAGNRWVELWDPKHYIPSIDIPVMWYGGAGDLPFDFGCVQKTFKLFNTDLYKVARPSVVHTDGVGPEGRPDEVYAFADMMLKGSGSYPTVAFESMKKGKVKAQINANGNEIVRAELYYITETESIWRERKWTTIEQTVTPKDSKVTFKLPEEAKAFFINIFTAEGWASSTEVIDVE